MPIRASPCPIRRLTSGSSAHFFGYYDKSPWDRTQRRVLALEVGFDGRMPAAGDEARICLVEAATGRCERLAETRAWNWQQGCMLQWLPGSDDRAVVYNDLRDGTCVAVILDVHSGAERVLPEPVYAVDRRGRFALTNNMARLAATRPVVGYAGLADPWADEPAPREDGPRRLDLSTGESRLVVSLHDVAAFEPVPSMAGAKQRLEHLALNPAGTRCFFVQRWPRAAPREEADFRRAFHDRLLSVGVDGSGLFAFPTGDFVSHFDWRDDERILVWGRHPELGTHYLLLRDRSEDCSVLGADVLTRDGHCSYAPDRRFVLTDSYASGGVRRVHLYEPATDTRYDVGSFACTPPWTTGPLRCDLHPRWRPDGRAVCIDSVHEASRQMYEIDVAGLVG